MNSPYRVPSLDTNRPEDLVKPSLEQTRKAKEYIEEANSLYAKFLEYAEGLPEDVKKEIEDILESAEQNYLDLRKSIDLISEGNINTTQNNILSSLEEARVKLDTLSSLLTQLEDTIHTIHTKSSSAVKDFVSSNTSEESKVRTEKDKDEAENLAELSIEAVFELLQWPENVLKELRSKFQKVVERLPKEGKDSVVYRNTLTKIKNSLQKIKDIRNSKHSSYEADPKVRESKTTSNAKPIVNAINWLDKHISKDEEIFEPPAVSDNDESTSEAEADSETQMASAPEPAESEDETVETAEESPAEAKDKDSVDTVSSVEEGSESKGENAVETKSRHREYVIDRSGNDIIGMSPRREAMLEAKRLQDNYEEALAAHYEKETAKVAGKFKQGVKSMFGLSPKLPVEIKKMKEEADAARRNYARALHERLKVRSRQESSMLEIDSASTSLALMKRFVIDPKRHEQKLQKELLSTKDEKSAAIIEMIGAVLNRAGKHKWKIRLAVVGLGAGVVGATGGLAAALAAGTYMTGRMVTGAAAGALAGSVTDKFMSRRVSNVEAKVVEAESGGVKFALDKLKELESEYGSLVDSKKRFEKQRKVGVVMSSAAAGSTAGYWGYDAGASVLDKFSGNKTPDLPSVKTPDGDIPGTVTGHVPPDLDDAETDGFVVRDTDDLARTGEVSIDTEAVRVEVKSGNTLSQLLHREMVSRFDSSSLKLPDGSTREALAQYMYRQYPEFSNPKLPVSEWRLSPEQWRELGVSSGNPHLIRPGEQINLTGLIERIESNPSATNPNVINRPSTGPLNITPDTQNVSVPINFDQYDAELMGVDIEESTLPDTEDEPDPDEDFLTGAVRDDGSDNPSFGRILDDASFIKAPIPFTTDGNYFSHPEYQAFAIENLGSIETVKSLLSGAIDRIEGKQGILDSMLNKPRAFDIIKDYTVADINLFVDDPSRLQRLAMESGVEKSALEKWCRYSNNLVNSGQVVFKDQTTVGDLFARTEVEKGINIKRA